MLDISMADEIHTAKKQNRKAPILYSLLCIFSSKNRTDFDISFLMLIKYDDSNSNIQI